MSNAHDAAVMRQQGIPVDGWTAKAEAEELFERQLRAYLTHPHKYQFGGMVNLMTTLATICEQEAANTGNENWTVAASEFKRLESYLDVDYQPLERSERGERG